MNAQSKRVLVVGATGGTGRETVKALLAAGHEVTAFSRSANKLPEQARLRRISGDATNVSDVEAAVNGQDAVIVTLGITENPIRVRLLGAKNTPTSVRSTGTQTVIEAMRRHHVKRLVVLSSYGVGETRGRLRLIDRLIFSLLLKPQIRDTERQEEFVRASTLDWVITQPVHLSDEPTGVAPHLSTEGMVHSFKVSRQQVAQFLASSATGRQHTGRSVAVSG